jgi:hypothetical protein
MYLFADSTNLVSCEACDLDVLAKPDEAASSPKWPASCMVGWLGCRATAPVQPPCGEGKKRLCCFNKKRKQGQNGLFN